MAFAKKKNLTFQVGILQDIILDRSSYVSYHTATYFGHHNYYFGAYTYPVVSQRENYFIKIKVDKILYIGQYYPTLFKTYRPSEWIVNDPVEVAFDRKYMYIKRPDGKLLKARILKRIRLDAKKKMILE